MAQRQTSRRRTEPTEAHTPFAIRIFTLLALGTGVLLLYRLMTGQIAFLPADSNFTLATYFAVIVLIVTPLGLLLTLEKSRVSKTGWDHAFYGATTCLFLYLLMLIGFSLVVVSALFGMLPAFNITSMFTKWFLLWPFWLVLFTMPTIFLNGPIIAAAHAVRHGLERERPSGWGHVGVGMTAASAIYVVMKLLPLAGNLYVAVIIAITLILTALSFVTAIIFGHEYRDLFEWIGVTGICVASVIAIATVFSL